MTPKSYWNPYLAGIVLGLVLLGSFLIAGQGLGGSALPKRTIALVGSKVAPAASANNPVLGGYLEDDSNPLKNWIVVEMIGVMMGGFIGAVSAGRFKATVEKGPRATTKTRLVYALAGGVIMGFAAGLARGCTSGQALSGGALLATGSWAFMLMVFAGGYTFAYFMRRQWT